MRLDYTYFHRELLKLRSLHYEAYKDATELDILVNILNYEDIREDQYIRIAWIDFKEELFGFFAPPTKAERLKDPFADFRPKSKLEAFINKIIPREERIRVLTFLRDNCEEMFLTDTDKALGYSENIGKELREFENECARLIYQNIEESKRDEYHGAFASLPRPNLKQIAMGIPKQREQSEEEKIILQSIPTFSNDRNRIRPDIILDEAKEQVRLFRIAADRYEESKDDKDKPCMSQKRYVEGIMNNLGIRANRFLYKDNNLAYQVLFAMAILMHQNNGKRTWWENNFEKGIYEYLEMTQNFKGSKQLIDEAVKKIRSLTELAIDFEESTAEILKPTIKAEPIVQIEKKVTLPKRDTQQNIYHLHNHITVSGDYVAGDKKVQNEVGTVMTGAIGIKSKITKEENG